MELRDYITAGIERIGSGKELAKTLGISANSVSDAKNHRHGIPAVSCVILAEIVGAEPVSVIAASELVTEKREEKRAVWLPFVTAESGGEGGIRTHGTLQYA
jgi:hypothetical protein